ncbi:MAG: hypothetical protein KatS3mg015_2939 [Fimbriimonadales bacterium]|nr:MAG: hypothetical protein KatS3mg015_2939 [Fimbriimonadales bacterium]
MMSRSDAYDLLYRVIVGLRLTYDEHCTLQQALHVLMLDPAASSTPAAPPTAHSLPDPLPDLPEDVAPSAP